MFKRLVLAATACLALCLPAKAADLNPAEWDQVVAQAKGETVYFNAWGGAENINTYLQWAAAELRTRFGIELVHVKLDDTATAVATVLAEKSANKTEGGSIDLVWINGENFAAMKNGDLLLGNQWAEHLPNFQLADIENKPTIRTDFTIPVEGQESPWGMAKLVFFYDSARTEMKDLPQSAAALLEWARNHPGRFTYPQPPDFTGSSFLKQVLAEQVSEPAIVAKQAEDATYSAETAPLFAYLDALNPLLWRDGRAFPQNYGAMKQLLADNEVDIIFAFNPSEAQSAIAAGELPDTVRSFTFPAGTLGNTHFVAIPFNANAKAAAMVTANFLLSPEAQARKQDPTYWGDPTVLALDKLSPEDRSRFEAIDLGAATLKPDQLGPALDEPHPSWMERIEADWTKRYGTGQ